MRDPAASGQGKPRGTYRRVMATTTMALAIFALAPTVLATHGNFETSIPITTIVRAPEGSETILASVDVDDGLVGELCAVSAVSENPDSVHPNNDLVVSTGRTAVLLPDVESQPNGMVVANGILELGPQITVTLVMGPDEVFSAGIAVSVECGPDVVAPPVTTTMVPDEVLPTVVTTMVPDEVLPTVVTTTVPDEVLPTVVRTTVPDEVSPTVVTTTLPDEALPSTLPFTGPGNGNLALIALALTGAGILFLVVSRASRN